MKALILTLSLGQMIVGHHLCFGQADVPPVGESGPVGRVYTAPRSSYERPQSQSSSTASQHYEEQRNREIRQKEAQWLRLRDEYNNAAAKGNFELAVQTLKQMKRLYPNDARIQRDLDKIINDLVQDEYDKKCQSYTDQAFKAANSGSWRSARENFELALEYAPSSKQAELKGLILEVRYNELLDTAEEAENEGYPDFALECYERAMSTYDNNRQAIASARNLVKRSAEKFIENKQYDRAIGSLKKMIGYNPDDDQARAYQTDIRRLTGWQRANELMREMDGLLEEEKYEEMVIKLREAVSYGTPDVEIMKEMLDHAREARDQAATKAIATIRSSLPAASMEQSPEEDKETSISPDFLNSPNLPSNIVVSINNINRSIQNGPSHTAQPQPDVSKRLPTFYEHLSSEEKSKIGQVPEVEVLLTEWRSLEQNRAKDQTMLDGIAEDLKNEDLPPALRSGLLLLQDRKLGELKKAEEAQRAKEQELAMRFAKAGSKINPTLKP